MKATEFTGIYAGVNSMRITFQYQGVTHRETIKGKPTKARLQELARKRDVIIYEISMGTFDYLAHFPESKKAFEFSGNKAAILTVEKAADFWISQNRSNWQYSTERRYNSLLKTHILPQWGKLKLSEFKPSHFKEWASITARSPKTKNEVRNVLSGIFKEQMYDEVIDSNPISKTKAVPRRKEEPKPFTSAEKEKILAALPDNSARDFYRFAFWTGFRTGEILGLRWEHIDFEKRKIYVRRSVVHGREKGTKTASSDRTHELHDEAFYVLEKIKTYHPRLHGEERVFLDPRTMQPWKNDGVPRERFWTSALKAAGVLYRCPYTCRHTYASTMLTNGSDPTWLSKQMGHSDWGMNRTTYARWIDN